MKNTETSTSECIKADVLYRRISRRINMLERQISECKKKFTCFIHKHRKNHMYQREKKTKMTYRG